MNDDTLQYLKSCVDEYRKNSVNRFDALLVKKDIIDELIDFNLIEPYGNILGDVKFTDEMLEKFNQ